MFYVLHDRQMHALDRVWLVGNYSITYPGRFINYPGRLLHRLLDPWREPDKLLGTRVTSPALIGRSNRRKGRKSNEQRWDNAERLEENGREPIRQLRGRGLVTFRLRQGYTTGVRDLLDDWSGEKSFICTVIRVTNTNM